MKKRSRHRKGGEGERKGSQEICSGGKEDCRGCGKGRKNGGQGDNRSRKSGGCRYKNPRGGHSRRRLGHGFIILVITMVALIVGSGFGIFYSPGDTDGLTLQGAVAEINTEYQAKIDDMKNSVYYDKLEMRGSRASWEDVLAVYAIKTSGNPENAQEVATMDEGKRDILKACFGICTNFLKAPRQKQKRL